MFFMTQIDQMTHPQGWNCGVSWHFIAELILSRFVSLDTSLGHFHDKYHQFMTIFRLLRLAIVSQERIEVAKSEVFDWSVDSPDAARTHSEDSRKKSNSAVAQALCLKKSKRKLNAIKNCKQKFAEKHKKFVSKYFKRSKLGTWPFEIGLIVNFTFRQQE